jgi:hypothetical protein
MEEDEIRRSINKTNIHAFFKHYYYKYWVTPYKPRKCASAKTHSTFREVAFEVRKQIYRTKKC